MSTGLKANSDGSAAIQVGGTDVITLTSGGAATFVTSPTTVQAGTAAAPSITFSGDTNTGIYSPGADTVGLTAGGTLVGSVGLGTTLALQGATSQSGTGITFPATQSASSNANTLDDYEEGTWTPTFGGSTSDPTGVAYGAQDGKYTKIGNLVNLNFYLSFSTYTGGSGIIYIKGVPFGASGNGDGALKIENVTLSAGRTYATVTAGSSFIFPQQAGSATTWIGLTIGTAVTSSGTTKYFTGSITYMV